MDDALAVDRVVLSEEPLPAYERELTGGYAPRLDDDEEVYSALVVGLRAYAAKNGFRSVLIGLSGGIDSALVAAIACDALGAENVYGISMPSKYSSDHSKGDAAELARRTGLNFRTVSIEPMFDAYMGSLGLTGLAEENLQSRLRGTMLMAVSNQEGHIVLAPGNKSELAVGYSTLYGDSVGAYGPIKDVYKTSVFRLAKWRNRAAEERGQTPPIPESSIVKPPSAELRPGQVDTGLATGLRRPGPDPGAVRRPRSGQGRDRGRRLRRGAGHEDPAPRRHGRVQAAPVPAGHQDLGEGLRQGPAPADHEPLARTRLIPRSEKNSGGHVENP